MNRNCAEQNFLNVKHGLRRLLLPVQLSYKFLFFTFYNKLRPQFGYLFLFSINNLGPGATERLGAEIRCVERWLRRRGAISHSANTCCSASVTNSRPECLLSVNGSLIRCTMEMGRRVCGPCCSPHQWHGFIDRAAWTPSHLLRQESGREHKPCAPPEWLSGVHPSRHGPHSCRKVQTCWNIPADQKAHLSFFPLTKQTDS